DAAFPDKSLQQRQFNAFRQLLANRPGVAQIDAFRSSFPAGITEGERNLLADTEAFIEDYPQLPAAARGIVFSAIDRMAQGMAGYARRSQPLRRVDFEKGSRYCSVARGVGGGA